MSSDFKERLARIGGAVTNSSTIETTVPTEYATIQEAVDDLLPFMPQYRVGIDAEAGHSEGHLRIPDYGAAVFDEDDGNTRSEILQIHGPPEDEGTAEIESIFVAGGRGPSDPRVRRFDLMGSVPNWRDTRDVGIIVAGGTDAAFWEIDFSNNSMATSDVETFAFEVYSADLNARRVDLGQDVVDVGVRMKRGGFATCEEWSGHVADTVYSTSHGPIRVRGGSTATADNDVYDLRGGTIYDDDNAAYHTPGRSGWVHDGTYAPDAGVSSFDVPFDCTIGDREYQIRYSLSDDSDGGDDLLLRFLDGTGTELASSYYYYLHDAGRQADTTEVVFHDRSISGSANGFGSGKVEFSNVGQPGISHQGQFRGGRIGDFCTSANHASGTDIGGLRFYWAGAGTFDPSRTEFRVFKREL